MSVQRKSLQVGQRVEVYWVDAQSDDDWRDIESVVEDLAPVIRTLGYVTAQEEGHISVSQNMDDENGMVSNTMLIPTGMIVDIIQL